MQWKSHIQLPWNILIEPTSYIILLSFYMNLPRTSSLSPYPPAFLWHSSLSRVCQRPHFPTKSILFQSSLPFFIMMDRYELITQQLLTVPTNCSHIIGPPNFQVATRCPNTQTTHCHSTTNFDFSSHPIQNYILAESYRSAYRSLP